MNDVRKTPRAGGSRSGTLIAVVGPSGAGKDTLISYARRLLEAETSVLFVRRIVTRIALAGAEDHDTMTVEAFAAARASGMFAVTWEAHGLHYAVPAEALRHVADGGVAVVNGSRAALPAIVSAFGRVETVQISCRPEVLEARLAARGRENASQQGRRLARAALPPLADAVEIDNSGSVEAAGDALVAVIRGARSDAPCPTPPGTHRTRASRRLRRPNPGT